VGRSLPTPEPYPVKSDRGAASRRAWEQDAIHHAQAKQPGSPRPIDGKRRGTYAQPLPPIFAEQRTHLLPTALQAQDRLPAPAPCAPPEAPLATGPTEEADLAWA
jgi:hypothetical protein